MVILKSPNQVWPYDCFELAIEVQITWGWGNNSEVGNTTAKGVVNAVFYQVRGWSETHVHIADSESDEELSVALDHMGYLRLRL